MTGLTDTIADGAIAGDSTAIIIAMSVSDSAAASDSVSFVFFPGGVVSDSALASDHVTTTIVRQKVLPGDKAKASDKVLLSFGRSVSDSAVASDAVLVSIGPTARDSARASDSVIPSIHYNVLASDSARARDSVATIKTLFAADTASASDGVTTQINRHILVADHASATDSVSGVRRLNLVLSDHAHGVDTPAIQMHYSVVIQDSAEAMDEAIPAGSLTCFVVNTRTNAVTQYNNTQFNSSFQTGRKYVIATDEGLFELNGATDEGNVNVIANIEGGYFDANDNKFSGLKGVYLKVKGQGGNSTPNWLLHLKTGDQDGLEGATYIYQAPANPGLMTSKFRIGKGIHASEIAWGVRNADGQDFDWDNIEFVPMMSGRRVG